MKLFITSIFLSLLFQVSGQNHQREELNIPDIPGYITLTCDFHMHTYFSDGEVIPGVRVREAWTEGIDAIAITDHIEWWRFKEGDYASLNKHYEDALDEAEKRDIILIRAIELTKSMPPGHMNMIFLKDVDQVDINDYRLALEEGKKQGAFIFWNHPGWEAQAPDGAKWYKEHTEMFEKGWMNGIEVANWNDWYPVVFDWILEKDLTIIGNSDVHMPAGEYLRLTGQEHRPLTLVFAKEPTEEGIHEALLEKRTGVWFKDLIIAREEHAAMLVREAIKIDGIRETGKEKYLVRLMNTSDFNFSIVEINDESSNQILGAGKSIDVTVHASEAPDSITLKLKNVKISSDKILQLTLTAN